MGRCRSAVTAVFAHVPACVCVLQKEKHGKRLLLKSHLVRDAAMVHTSFGLCSNSAVKCYFCIASCRILTREIFFGANGILLFSAYAMHVHIYLKFCEQHKEKTTFTRLVSVYYEHYINFKLVVTKSDTQKSQAFLFFICCVFNIHMRLAFQIINISVRSVRICFSVFFHFSFLFLLFNSIARLRTLFSSILYRSRYTCRVHTFQFLYLLLLVLMRDRCDIKGMTRYFSRFDCHSLKENNPNHFFMIPPTFWGRSSHQYHRHSFNFCFPAQSHRAASEQASMRMKIKCEQCQVNIYIYRESERERERYLWFQAAHIIHSRRYNKFHWWQSSGTHVIFHCHAYMHNTHRQYTHVWIKESGRCFCVCALTHVRTHNHSLFVCSIRTYLMEINREK